MAAEEDRLRRSFLTRRGLGTYDDAREKVAVQPLGQFRVKSTVWLAIQRQHLLGKAWQHMGTSSSFGLKMPRVWPKGLRAK